MCSSYYDASGIMKDLDDSEKMKFEQRIQGMAASSLRCIAFAHKQISKEDQEHDMEQKKIEEDGLTLLGLVGIKDPCRPGVKKAVEDCQNAGVNIKMITGDNVFTAKAIAIECGILRFDQDMSEAVVEGIEFRNYTPKERLEKVDKICVMARSSPFDKLLMVEYLKQKGHVVAVTGDGTNDAPTLKEADVGLSMGIQGTKVAKESSDIVILDDNFTSITTVLRWGRCVYNNIQKFIQFQLTVNVVALVINFVAAVSAGEVPLTAVQLLWVNLIMDTLGALALATEKPTKELMTKPPIGRTEPLITNIMWRNLLAQALYQIIVLLTLQFKGESIFGVTKKVNDTLIFNTFVLCQVFNEFNARKLEKKNVFKGIHTNKLFMGIIVITIVLQVVMVELLKKFTGTERLNWGQWVECIGFGIVSWPIGWIVKWIPVPKRLFLRLKTDQASLTKIDQKTLTELVKEKNIQKLQIIGGIDRLVSVLKTNVESGIQGNIEDIAHRHEAFGTNTYKRPPTKSFFHFLVEAFKVLTILILLGCAVLFLGFGIKENGIKGRDDSVSIFVALFLVIAVPTISNFWQNREFNKLSKVSNNIQIEVVRAGRRQQISIFEIVVGDVICLKNGDQVPADGLFLDGHSLQVDESSMTGESDHVEVNCTHPFLFSGTKVVDGYARMLVTSVGMNTIWGKMMSSISRDTNEQTPLQVRLNKLTSSISKVGLAVAFLVLVVFLVRCFTGNTTDENGNKEFNGGSTMADDIINAMVGFIAAYEKKNVVAGFVAATITIVMVAIPEGLPLAVTVALAYSVKSMLADQAMVRKRSACETMGSVTTICTHKTGTLTLNEMKVTKFWLGKESFVPTTYSSIAPYIVELLREGVALNTTGSVYRPTSGSEIEFSRSPTEQAILSWDALKLHIEMEQLTQSRKILYVEAFNSQKKQSGVITRRKTDNTIHVHWKGAAEMILKMRSSYYDASGIMKDLDDGEKMKFEQIIQGMASSSLRCIAFAHKQISKEDQEHDMEQKKIEEDGLTLLGLVGIQDPCRPGVKKAVENCQNAGVNIKMITGDNVFTAKAIAVECGILRIGQDMSGAVVESIEFRNYTLKERMEKVDKICVMARSSPFDKLLMVECLKQKGHVVAITGDDTNDAPALKEADVGLSMGIQGTEVAKESSDVVILDDNFASVATVLRWGRCVYNNIQKFIQFQLTVNVAALVINFVAAISAGEVPLTAVQLLWVNLIMDTLGALALATEKPTKELMTKPPVGRIEPLITNIMWRNLLAQALYQIIVLLTLQFKGESIFGVTEKVNDTLIFNTFVLCQVFNEFNARKLEKKNVFKGIHRNKLFLGIIAITIVLQVVMVEFLKKFAGTERLNWGQWGECIGFGIVSWPIGWIVKWIPVPKRPFLSYLNMKKMQGLPTPFPFILKTSPRLIGV